MTPSIQLLAVTIFLVIGLSSCDRPKKCVDGRDFHVFIQFDKVTEVPCTAGTCRWNAIGFYPKSTKYNIGAIYSTGILKDDSKTLCVRWDELSTPSQGAVVQSMINKGWDSATYSLGAGAKICGPRIKYCDKCPTFNSCQPLSTNVCWTFACAYACTTGETGTLSSEVTAVPVDWTCAPEHYGTNDGCHCKCGAWDPDCTGGDDFAAEGCPDDHVCLPPGDVCMPRHEFLVQRKNIARAQGFNVHEDGVASMSSDVAGYDPVLYSYGKSRSHQTGKTATSAPAGWTCPEQFYDNDDGCDCECGVWDPDCDDSTQSVTNCEIDPALHLQERYRGDFDISYTCLNTSLTCVKSVSGAPSSGGWGTWKITGVVLLCVVGLALLVLIIVALAK